MVAYGLEALGTMRIEKGHVTGAEIDGRTTGRDLHLDWMLSKKKPFVGSDDDGPRRPRPRRTACGSVGIVSLDNLPLNGGAPHRRPSSTRNEAARLRSATSPPSVIRRRWANISAWRWSRAASSGTARARYISDPLRKRFGPVEIVSHHFFDPEGKRMHG